MQIFFITPNIILFIRLIAIVKEGEIPGQAGNDRMGREGQNGAKIALFGVFLAIFEEKYEKSPESNDSGPFQREERDSNSR